MSVAEQTLSRAGSDASRPRTQEEIARIVGLTRVTVNKALHGAADVKPETRERVLEVARRLGYRPHAGARAIRSGRFGCLAVLLGTRQDEERLPSELLGGMQDELAVDDQQLMISRLPAQDAADASRIPRILREWFADGLLIHAREPLPESAAAVIRDAHVPAVWLAVKRDADCVHADDFGAGWMAVEHLMRLGHRRIAYMDTLVGESELASAHYSHRDRQAGYSHAMQCAGIDPLLLRPGAGADWEQRVALCEALLAGPDRPTALFAYSVDATDVLQAAAERTGLRIPANLAVVTVAEAGAGLITRERRLRWTALRPPHAQVGRAAVAAVMRKIDNPLRPLAPEAIPYTLDAGQTAIDVSYHS